VFFVLVKRVTGGSEWEEITRRRTKDLLVYMALGRFQRRPPMTALPLGLQRDIRAFFGSYTKACRQADDHLFRSGNAEAVDEACRRATVGKLLPNALYIHRDAFDGLEPLLRVYQGCARAYVGEVEGANVIKLHRHSGKVFYKKLVYPDFDTDPHPALLRSIKLSLRTRELDCYDYANSTDPPVFHHKETFLPADHPLHARFARLTQQEEMHGLLDETATIGTQEGWQRRLHEKGYALRGHRLVRQEGDHGRDQWDGE
jgi:DNA phosphorothioation-associated putative methyltransferase